MNKRLKILADMHCFDQEYQGSYTFVKELYKKLIHERSIDFYLAAYNIENLKEIFGENDNVHYIRYRSRNALIRLGILLPAIIRKYKIDYAHFQYITPLFKNCKTVVTIHDVLFDDLPKEFTYTFRKLKKFLYKRSARKADLITTVSDFSKTSIIKYLQVPEQKITIVNNGVSENFFIHTDSAKAKLYIKEKYGIEKFILYVSRIEKRKNHTAICKAFHELELAKRGYQLVFIGHASESLETVIGSSIQDRLQNALFVLNAVPEKDLIRFYRACEFFVYASKGEGFGIPPLEAAAAGAPVICSNSTAMKAFDFFGQYHFDPESEYELKNKIAEMLAVGLENERLQSITKRIQQKYSWSEASARFTELIKNAS